MTTFNFTTGNPANLTGGAGASMNDIQGPLTDLRTFLNGGNIDAANLAPSARPATLLAQFSGTPLEAHASMGAGLPGGTYWLTRSGTAKASGTADATPVPLIEFGVGGYAVSGLTARARVVCSVLVNNTPPGGGFAFGLHGIASVGGGAGVISLSTSGALAGSTAAISSPAANTATQGVSADFAIPSSGSYGLAVVPDVPIAANSFVQLHAALQIHWI